METLGPWTALPGEPEEERDFQAVIEEAGNREDRRVSLESPEEKKAFLTWLVSRDYYLHGTNCEDLPLDRYLPVVGAKRLGDPFPGRPGLYATNNPLWAMFYGVMDHTRAQTRNLFSVREPLKKGEDKRWYYFAVATAKGGNFWREGFIYIYPKSAFEKDAGSDLFVSFKPMTVKAVLKVEPEDFPLADRVHGLSREDAMVVARMPFQMAGWVKEGSRGKKGFRLNFMDIEGITGKLGTFIETLHRHVYPFASFQIEWESGGPGPILTVTGPPETKPFTNYVFDNIQRLRAHRQILNTSFTGYWRHPRLGLLEVTHRQDGLYLALEGRRAARMVCKSEDRYHEPKRGLELRFLRRWGKVQQVIIHEGENYELVDRVDPEKA